MNLAQLKKLVARGESEQLEFKKSTNSRSLAEAGKTICGFLNKGGGILLFGVIDHGGLIGQEVTDKTKIEIAENVLKDFNPHAPVQVEYISCDNRKQIIMLKTREDIKPPYYYKNVAYLRSGTTTQIMPPSLLEELLEEKKWHNKSWDLMPARGVTINSLDHDEIYSFIQEAIVNRRLTNMANQSDLIQILHNLKLAENGQINNAGVVLFAKKEISDFDHCNIKMARFNGNDRTTGFLDEKRFTGNAFALLREAEIFIKRHLSLAMKITSKDFQREETYAVPLLAVREALVNALIHRDYSLTVGSINVAIYNDWMEIWNIGKLSSLLNLKDLTLTHHNSYPRNKLIAETFYKRNLFEGWGTGTSNMIKLCQAQNLQAPSFTEYSGGFCVRFYMKAIEQKIAKQKLNTRQENIVRILQAYPEGITSVKIVTELNETITDKTIRRELHKLETMGMITSIGSTKDKLWRCINDA